MRFSHQSTLRSLVLGLALGLVMISAESALSRSAFAASPTTQASAPIEIKIPCGGRHYPECSVVISTGDSKENPGLLKALEGRVSKLVDGVYKGQWLNVDLNPATNTFEPVSGKNFAKPTTGAAPGICAIVPLKFHENPAHRCKTDLNFVQKTPTHEENSNHLGESCGVLAPIFPNHTGTNYKSPILIEDAQTKYFGRETSYVTGMLAVALSHHFEKVKEGLVANQTLKVSGGCRANAAAVKAEIDNLESFKAKKLIKDGLEREADILIHMKQGCDENQLSNCPTQQYLKSAYSHLQMAMISLASCVITEQAAADYRAYQSEALEEIKKEVIEKCLHQHAGDIRATNTCYRDDFRKYLNAKVNERWNKASKGCAP